MSGLLSKLSYDVFQTEMGWIAIVGGDNGIVRASLPESSPEAALELVRPEIAESLDTESRWAFSPAFNIIMPMAPEERDA